MQKENKVLISPKKEYLSYKNGVLYYKDINLLDCVKKYGNPLKVGYVEIIKEKITHLQNCFYEAIKNNNYTGSYFFANANKASYYSENIITAGNSSDMIETSSYADLCIVERIMKKNIVSKKTIIVNGVKNNNYLNKIYNMNQNGFHFCFIVDNITEFNILMSWNLKTKMEIGVRVNLENAYTKNKHQMVDRFGLQNKEIDYVINNYTKNKNLIFTTIHFHQRGSDYNKIKAFTNIEKAFQVYVKCSKKVTSIKNLNIGGGTPYHKTEEYNYMDYANSIVSHIKSLAESNHVPHPNIIQENGRYTVSDSCFNIYKVTRIKKGADNIFWYIINGSIMTSFINTWALKENFLFLPINLQNQRIIKARLAGSTCDSSDTYYYQDNQKFLYMPEIKEGETLYIGVFGIGAYQEILSGIGGIHHCQILEENDLIIYKKNNKTIFYKIRGRQTLKSVFKRLNYLKTKEMKRYI